MRFAKFVFTVAGIWGLLVLTPLLFLEQRIGVDHPPAITHPEYFYGFAFVALAFQIVFLIISRDPVRYRPLMLACMVEKFPFVVACAVMYTQGRLYPAFLVGPAADLILGILFFAAYIKTGSRTALAASSSA
jgi:hypothetical protein